MKNKKEDKVEAKIWKVYSNEEGSHYHLQIEGIEGKKIKNKVLSYVTEWKQVGHGWNSEQKETLLLSRKFKEKSSCVEWAKQFPFDIKEVNRNGKIKKIN